MSRFTFGVLLLVSLNSFAVDDPKALNRQVVNFPNGASLVLNYFSKVARELLYFAPGKSTPVKLLGGSQMVVSLLSDGSPYMTPAEIINAKFDGRRGGMAPMVWPVVVTNNDPTTEYKASRMYVSEAGQVLEVIAQSRNGLDKVGGLDFPNKWEVKRLLFEGLQYLVLIEEGAHERMFLFLRLNDGHIAHHLDFSGKANRDFFDETSGLLLEEKNDGEYITRSIKDMTFQSVERPGQFGVTWFPDLQQARGFHLPIIGPLKAIKGENPEDERDERPKKENLAKRAENDIAEIRRQKAEFKESAAQFAAYLEKLKSSVAIRPEYKPLSEFQGNRFSLAQISEKTLGVIDGWTGEITHSITLEDETFSVINTPNAYTTTIAYPKLHLEVVYKQPSSHDPQLRQIARHEESIPEFCRDLLAREKGLEETAK